MFGSAGLLHKGRSTAGRIARFWTNRPVLLAAVAVVVTAGVVLTGVKTMVWMESPAFCGSCHTMQPEIEAHERSSHQSVDCAECHVGAGITGLIKSKWGGMQQTVKLITGHYPRPIPPAAHGMPPASETCARCHDPARARGEQLLVRSHFLDDAANTEQRVALVLRMSDDPARDRLGIHWHVQSTVTYISADPLGRTIDWIGVENPDGTKEQYIAGGLVDVSTMAARRADELRARSQVRRMSCYDCHNRVGHALRTPSRALDDALDSGRIDRDIPFIKKRGLEVLSASYASLAEADAAITALGASYHREFPEVALGKPQGIAPTLAALAEIYRETADPEMRANAAAYPSYLGHTDSAGCFRCHDGGHYKIERGALTKVAVPSQCSTCHTFPSVGKRTPNVMLGPPPPSHGDRLWVFNHRNEASSTDPARTTCSACHSRTYCQNCHTSGAMNVKHDNMLFDHAAVVRQNSAQACTYCHQKPFCDRCHVNGTNPGQ